MMRKLISKIALLIFAIPIYISTPLSSLAQDQNLSVVKVVLDADRCNTNQIFRNLLLKHGGVGPLKNDSSRSDIQEYVSILNDSIKSAYGKKCRLEASAGIHGDITPEVLPYVKAAIQLIKTENSSGIELVLNSKGGLVSEAMKIGDYVSFEKLSVSVPSNSECLSSCVLIYAAGVHRFGNGNIGIHRPFSYEITTENLDYTQYLEVYDSTFLFINRYLRKFGVSPAVVDAMGSIPSDKIKILNKSELDAWGLGKDNIAKKEFDKARTIQICGKDFQALEAEYRARIDACVNSPSVSLNSFSACYDKADTAFPTYNKQRAHCSSLMTTP